MKQIEETNTLEGMGRPRKPPGERYVTPPSSFRIPAAVKRAAMAAAREQGEDLTKAIVRMLAAYATRHGHPPSDYEEPP